MQVIPKSIPVFSAATSRLRRNQWRPISQVPCPSAGIVRAIGKSDSFVDGTQKNALVLDRQDRARFFAISLTNYFLTISAFSSMDTPPLLAILPFKVTVLPANGASSSFIGLCAPTTR